MGGGGFGGGWAVSLVPLVSGSPNPTDRISSNPIREFFAQLSQKKGVLMKSKKPTGYKMALDFLGQCHCFYKGKVLKKKFMKIEHFVQRILQTLS